LPALYIMGASLVLVILFMYRPATTWPGLLIVALGAPVYFLIRSRRKSMPDEQTAVAGITLSE